VTRLLRCLWPQLGVGVLGTSLCWDCGGDQATRRAGTPSSQLTSAPWDESHPRLLKAVSAGVRLVPWVPSTALRRRHHEVGLLCHASLLLGIFLGPCPELVKLGKVQVLSLQLCGSRASDPVADCWTFAPKWVFLGHSVPWWYRNVVVGGSSV